MPDQDWAKTWHDPNLGLRVMHANFVRHAYPRHAHDYYVICVVDRGRQSFLHAGRKHYTPVGGLILINPGEVHTGEAAIRDGFAYRALYPSADLLLSPLRSSVLNPFSRYLVSWRCNILSRYTGAHHPTIKRNPPLCRPSPTMH